MSSIGIYPQIETEISEDSLPNSALNQNLLWVETLLLEYFPQLNILRLGGLMGDNRVFANFKVEGSSQIVNHVHYIDVCRLFETMIKNKSNSKLYNVVAPMHPCKQEILNYQLVTDVKIGKPFGRKIIAEKSEKELGFVYKFQDPKVF